MSTNSSDFITDNGTPENRSDWRVVKKVGNGGGTSQSFIANIEGKEFFVKCLKEEFLVSPIYRNLFQKEHSIGSSISHHNIVTYHDFVNNDKKCCIVMENIVGETLDRHIELYPDYFKSRANLDKFFNQLLSALKCLHENHIVFSDLKPGNIMITQINNDLKLIDLGFCFTDSFSTSAGATKGYASPEHTIGGRLDVSTDIYGIGKIIEYIGRHSAHNLPNIYTKLMLRCLKHKQSDRFQSTDELLYLINKRRHIIRKSIIISAICFALFVLIKSLSYNVHVVSWWDSFQLVSPHIDYDIKYRHSYYKIISEIDKTCATVGCNENPNLYLHKDVQIGNTKYYVTEIGDSAFLNKTYITSAYIPNGVTRIGKDAFRNCRLIKDINIPNSITEIGDLAFYNCTNLKHVKLPKSIDNIPIGAFAGTNINKIIVPEGIKIIYLDAFGNCENLKEITLPESLTCIERGVFWNCISLKQISIPQNVKEIGSYVFFGCDSLTDIYNYAIEPQQVLPIHRNPQKVTLHVPTESVEAYRDAEQWGEMRIVGDL